MATPSDETTQILDDAFAPRRFRFRLAGAPSPSTASRRTRWGYGVYFPLTDLAVTDRGHRSTGQPADPDIEWIDAE